MCPSPNPRTAMGVLESLAEIVKPFRCLNDAGTGFCLIHGNKHVNNGPGKDATITGTRQSTL